MPAAAWIVVPTLCEAANVERMAGALRAVGPSGAHVLIVDDASPDGTGAIADRLAATDENISVLHRESARGLGPAYVDGFAHALAHGAGSIVQIDCDFSHDPAMVPVLLRALDAGADLALGRDTCPAAAWRTGRPGDGPCRARAAPTRARSCACPCGT